MFKLADGDTLSAAELIERAQAAARRRTTLRPHAAVSSEAAEETENAAKAA